MVCKRKRVCGLRLFSPTACLLSIHLSVYVLCSRVHPVSLPCLLCPSGTTSASACSFCPAM